MDGLAMFPGIKFSCLAPDAACEGTHKLAFKVVSLDGDEFTVSSGPFDLTWQAHALVMQRAPAGCTGGKACATQPIIAVQDSSGHVVSSRDTGEVTVSISVPPAGNAAAVLSGALRVGIIAGVGEFTDLSIDLSHADAYEVRFECPELSFHVDVDFTVSTGAPHSLVVTAQPASIVPGQAFSISVIAQDRGQNQWVSALGAIEPEVLAQLDRDDTSLSSPILSGPSCAGYTGVCRQRMSGNVAVFSGLRIDKAPAVYRVRLTGSPAGIALETFSNFFWVPC